jgi:uncharacterized membrane protein (UPF0182 family)
VKLAQLSARVILVLWAGFWILFVVGSVFFGGGKTDVSSSESLKGILFAVSVVLVCAGAIYFAWRPSRVAGISSILVGILVTGAFLIGVGLNFVLVLIALPPFLSGILFLVSSRRSRSA